MELKETDLIFGERDVDWFNSLDNPYISKYWDFINSAKNKGRSLKMVPGMERHHIIPKAFGGPDDKTNKVALTTLEHIQAHYYLALGTGHIHMLHAFSYMMGKNRFTKLSSVEQATLEEMKYFAELRDFSKQRRFSEKARGTISEKAKNRWQRFRESGRVDEVCRNIAKTTAEGMKASIKSQIRTRVNLGCKKYWNPETGEQRNWYPGMPEFGSPWVRGRGPMNPEQKEKLSRTLQNCKKHWYHNDTIKENKTFNEGETVPAGWTPGLKQEYYGNRITRRTRERIDCLGRLKNSAENA